MFAEWDRRFAADRAAFLESIAPLLRGSPTSYGELVAQWFLKLHTAEAAKCA